MKVKNSLEFYQSVSFSQRSEEFFMVFTSVRLHDFTTSFEIVPICIKQYIVH